MTRPFRLGGLERYRARLLRERRLELAQARAAVRAADLRARQLATDETAARRAMANGEVEPARLAAWSALVDATRVARFEAEARRRERIEAESRAVEAAAHARQELRVVERLREKREEEARAEEARADERRLNDMNAGRHVLRQMRPTQARS